MQLQRELRDRARRHTGRKESGGRPEKVGMRTRDRDRSETHTHTKLPPKAVALLRKHISPTSQSSPHRTTSTFGIFASLEISHNVADRSPSHLPLLG